MHQKHCLYSVHVDEINSINIVPDLPKRQGDSWYKATNRCTHTHTYSTDTYTPHVHTHICTHIHTHAHTTHTLREITLGQHYLDEQSCFHCGASLRDFFALHFYAKGSPVNAISSVMLIFSLPGKGPSPTHTAVSACKPTVQLWIEWGRSSCRTRWEVFSCRAYPSEGQESIWVVAIRMGSRFYYYFLNPLAKTKKSKAFALEFGRCCDTPKTWHFNQIRSQQ